MNSVINLERVNKNLGNREILKGISFTVKPGDIFGYLGPNGAGKTTTIRVVLGLLKPNSGKAYILGRDAEDDITREKVGFVLEADGLYDNLTAYENLDYYCQIYSVSPAQKRERIEEMLQLVGLWDRASDKVSAYSKGMRQRLALARAMVHDPEILILDEPTAGVDPSGQIEVRELILNMAHQKGKTIFLSSHNLDEVQRICNRIALIDRGEIKLYGKLYELQRKMGKGEVVIETTEAIAEPILAELQSLPEISIQNRRDKNLILCIGKGSNVSDIVNFLTQRGVRIEQVKRREASVEEIYTSILKEVEQQ